MSNDGCPLLCRSGWFFVPLALPAWWSKNALHQATPLAVPQPGRALIG
jgi:hypothetical protein